MIENDTFPYFTIITATYHSSKMLGRTADSLRAQTERDFEWFIIDGASTDDTVDEIKRAGSLVTYWSSEPDLGISDAWNKGISRSNGRYILILNAGDTYDPDFLASVRQVADGTRIVCSCARLLTEAREYIGTFWAHPHKLHRGMHLPHNWCAVPRERYYEFGLYRNIPLSMDFDWFHKYFKRYGIDGFIVIPSELGVYHLGGKSDSGYVSGFRMNELIMVENGRNWIMAKLYRILYTSNHWLQRRIGIFR